MVMCKLILKISINVEKHKESISVSQIVKSEHIFSSLMNFMRDLYKSGIICTIPLRLSQESVLVSCVVHYHFRTEACA